MKSRLTLILTILAALCQGEWCPIECYCDASGGGVTCTGNKLLSHFPEEIYANGPTFTNASPLARLELHEYNVGRLGRANFLQLLGGPGQFLAELSLSRNAVEELDNDTFSLVGPVAGLPFPLRILDLSQNRLSYFLGGGRLRNVKILDLSSNQLQQVYGLKAMSSLESVNLRENRIRYLDPTTFQVGK